MEPLSIFMLGMLIKVPKVLQTSKCRAEFGDMQSIQILSLKGGAGDFVVDNGAICGAHMVPLHNSGKTPYSRKPRLERLHVPL